MPVSGFKWAEDLSEFNEGFLKSCNEKIKEGYLSEVDIQYPENLYNARNDSLFLSEKMKIEKVEKLAANLHGKN